jgi:hypothetical protein
VRSTTFLFTTLCTSIQIFGVFPFQMVPIEIFWSPRRDIAPATMLGAPARAPCRAAPAAWVSEPCQCAFPRPHAPQATSRPPAPCAVPTGHEPRATLTGPAVRRMPFLPSAPSKAGHCTHGINARGPRRRTSPRAPWL